MKKFSHRLATIDDMPVLNDLMNRAMEHFLPNFLSPEQVAASYEIMGLDSRLVADKSYFLVFDDGSLAGCGGWSRRQTLFGGDHSSGRNPRKLDPKTEPARIRAMYTDPDHARKGVGRFILQLCENAAASEGFSRVELAATSAGIALYKACGYRTIKAWNEITTSGIAVPLTLMRKNL